MNDILIAEPTCLQGGAKADLRWGGPNIFAIGPWEHRATVDERRLAGHAGRSRYRWIVGPIQRATSLGVIVATGRSRST